MLWYATLVLVEGSFSLNAPYSGFAVPVVTEGATVATPSEPACAVVNDKKCLVHSLGWHTSSNGGTKRWCRLSTKYATPSKCTTSTRRGLGAKCASSGVRRCVIRCTESRPAAKCGRASSAESPEPWCRLWLSKEACRGRVGLPEGTCSYDSATV